jgi:hypothetical protein
MRPLATVLLAIVALGLCGCAGVYVAGDAGAGAVSTDAHPKSP